MADNIKTMLIVYGVIFFGILSTLSIMADLPQIISDEVNSLQITNLSGTAQISKFGAFLKIMTFQVTDEVPIWITVYIDTIFVLLGFSIIGFILNR